MTAKYRLSFGSLSFVHLRQLEHEDQLSLVVSCKDS